MSTVMREIALFFRDVFVTIPSSVLPEVWRIIACFVDAVWAIIFSLWLVIRRALCLHLEHAEPWDPAPPLVYRESIALCTLIVVSAGGLIFRQREKSEPDNAFTIMFAVISGGVLLTMWLIINAQRKSEKRRMPGEPAKHAYERGSIMATQVLLPAFAFVSIMLTMASYSGNLGPAKPFTQVIALKVEKVEDDTFGPNKKPGLSVFTRISREAIKRPELPKQLRVRVVLLDKLYQSWLVREAEATLVEGRPVNDDFGALLRNQDKDTPDTWTVSIEGLEPGKDCNLRLRIRPTESSKVSLKSISDVKTSMENQKLIRIECLMQPER